MRVKVHKDRTLCHARANYLQTYIQKPFWTLVNSQSSKTICREQVAYSYFELVDKITHIGYGFIAQSGLDIFVLSLQKWVKNGFVVV